MADLMRMLENYSRRAKQEEDKISAATQQEELLRKEIADARALNSARRQELAEAEARCGEITSDVQQKTATIDACKATNESTKQEITSLQQQRQQLWQRLQELREEFIAACAQLDTETKTLLNQLQSKAAMGEHLGFGLDVAADRDVGSSHVIADKQAAAASAPQAAACVVLGDQAGPDSSYQGQLQSGSDNAVLCGGVC